MNRPTPKPPKPPGKPPVTSTMVALTDKSGVALTDKSGRVLGSTAILGAGK